MVHPGKPRTLKGRALQALALRDHSRAELRTKLLRAAEAEAEVDVAVNPAANHAANLTVDPAVDPTVAPAVDAPLADPATAQAARMAAVEALLDELEAKGFLSDARFVESRVQARSARYGNLRIRQELRLRGVALDAASEDELRRTELERARGVWARKFGGPPQTPAEAARQMRFLAGRGFSAEIIRKVVSTREDS